MAKRKLLARTQLVWPYHDHQPQSGVNEWIKAQTGRPMGRDWQIWSAAMHLYAAACVEHGRTPFFDELRRLPERRSTS